MLPAVAVSRRRLAASAVTLVLTAGALIAAPSANAAPADTAPTITGVRLSDEFGGLTPYIPTACGLVVSFTDTTPSANDGYLITATAPDGTTEESRFAFAPESSPSQFSGSVPCPTTVDGDLFNIKVTEPATTPPETPEPFTYELAVTGHPANARMATERTTGTPEFVVGDVVNISFDGAWEPGTRFSTQVWTSKTAEFDGDDFSDNRPGPEAIVAVYDSPDLTSTFTIPARAQGRWVWVSVLGEKAGEVRWLFTFNAIRVADAPDTGPKTQPKRWVKSFGAVSKKPRVGKVARLTSAPELSQAGRTAGLKVSYQWVIGKNTPIKGAIKKSYRVPAKNAGKKLGVYVVFSKAGFTTRFKKLSAGVVRGR